MAQPQPYNRAFNFANFQASNPTAPLPAAQLEAELSRIKAVTDEIRSVIAIIQRDDTALANASVGFDQLKTEVEIGVNPPAPWATATNYIERDTVFTNSNFYICLESHVSGTFSTDLAAGKWSLIASFEAATSALSVTYDGTSAGLAAATVQAALDEVDGNVDTVTSAVAALDASGIPFTPTGLDHTNATEVQSAVADLDAAVTLYGERVGVGKDFWGTTAPDGYIFAYGQAISRTTYSALFAVLGTTYGVGDGSTTFNVPDKRGRASFGKDNMGGVSANRITDQSGGFDGDTLGDTGGSETHTLTASELAAHAHGSGTLATTSSGSHTHGGSLFIGAGGAGAAGGANALNNPDTAGAHTHTIVGSTASAGSDTAHNNLPPGIVCNYIIFTGV